MSSSTSNGNPGNGRTKYLKREEILQQNSKLFSAEFNQSALHDRVLVLQVIIDEDASEEFNAQVKELPNEMTRSQDHIQFVGRRVPLFVHSCLLAVQSPYFKSLFYSGMKETRLKEVVMEVTEGEVKGYETLIEAMYKLDILNEKDYKLVVQVLRLADKHDVNLVFKKCKYVLLDTPHTFESCHYVWQHAQHLPHCEDLRDHLQKFLLSHFTPFDQKWTSNEFVQLSEVLVELLLSSDSLSVESENTIFAALMKWMEYNHMSPCSCSLESLLSVVRFEFLTSNFLCDVVDGHPIASQMFGYEQQLYEGLRYHCYSQARINLMKEKPVVRNADKFGHTELLNIDKNSIDQLLDPDKSHKVRWDSFWYNGYELSLELVYTGTGNTNSLCNNVELYLNVKNISNDAYLKVTWSLEFPKLPALPPHERRGYRTSAVFGSEGFSSKISFCSNVFASTPDVSHTIRVNIMA